MSLYTSEMLAKLAMKAVKRARNGASNAGNEGEHSSAASAPNKHPKRESDYILDSIITKGDYLVTTNVGTVTPEPVSWLWNGYIPKGKLTVLEGDPGLGKSTLACGIAAAVSTGRPLPGGTESAPRKVLILSAEDGLADTIQPRLVAAGAELDFVEAIEAAIDTEDEQPVPVSLPEHLFQIGLGIKNHDAGLVIVDPLSAFLSRRVSYLNDQEVRTALAPLAALAQETGAAVLVIRHLNKRQDARAIYRGGGSIGISAAARSVLLVAESPEDDNDRILAPVKNNLGPKSTAIAFHLEASDNGAAAVVWDGPSSLSAEDLIGVGSKEQGPTRLDEACAFLESVLRDGPRPLREVEGEAVRKGIAAGRTLNRALAKIGGRSQRKGFGPDAYYEWSLPDDTDNGSGSTQPGDSNDVR